MPRTDPSGSGNRITDSRPDAADPSCASIVEGAIRDAPGDCLLLSRAQPNGYCDWVGGGGVAPPPAPPCWPPFWPPSPQALSPNATASRPASSNGFVDVRFVDIDTSYLHCADVRPALATTTQKPRRKIRGAEQFGCGFFVAAWGPGKIGRASCRERVCQYV